MGTGMKVLNKEQQAELLQLETTVEGALLAIFKLIHYNDDLGDETGKYFNAVGQEKQDQYLAASNQIKAGFEALKKL